MNPEDLAHDFGSGGPEEGYYSFSAQNFLPQWASAQNSRASVFSRAPTIS